MIISKLGNILCRVEDRKLLILRIFREHFPTVNNKDNTNKGREKKTHRRLHLNIQGKKIWVMAIQMKMMRKYHFTSTRLTKIKEL